MPRIRDPPEAGPREGLNRGMIDRPGTLGAAEDEHAHLVFGEAESAPGGNPIADESRHRAAGDAVAAAVPPLDREGEMHAPGERSSPSEAASVTTTTSSAPAACTRSAKACNSSTQP